MAVIQVVKVRSVSNWIVLVSQIALIEACAFFVVGKQLVFATQVLVDQIAASFSALAPQICAAIVGRVCCLLGKVYRFAFASTVSLGKLASLVLQTTLVPIVRFVIWEKLVGSLQAVTLTA